MSNEEQLESILLVQQKWQETGLYRDFTIQEAINFNEWVEDQERKLVRHERGRERLA